MSFKPSEHLTILWLGSAVTAFGLGWGACYHILTGGHEILSQSELRSRIREETAPLNEEKERLSNQLKSWTYSAPLYEKMPGDIDVLIRGLRISKEVGSSVRIVGPTPGDNYSLSVSNLLARDQSGYDIAFSLSGVVATNEILPGNEPLIEMQRHAISGPFQAGAHEFYVFIDEERIDYLTVSVARRRSMRGKVTGNIGPIGAFHVGGPRPGPVMVPRGQK